MAESVPHSNRARARELFAQLAAAAAFLVIFEYGARAVGERLPAGDHKERFSPAAGQLLQILDFTRDPASRADVYLGFAGTSPLFVPAAGQDGNKIYSIAPNKAGTYREGESFLYEKPRGGVRVFCIGGSSVHSAGMPAEGTFPRLLASGLRAALPGTPVEVVNCGGGGTGSYQYREVAREAARHGADLIVVYPEGGERRYLPPQPEGDLAERDAQSPARAAARRWLAKSRLYIGIRDLINAMRPERAKPPANVTFSLTAIDAALRPFSEETFTRVFDFKHDRVPPAMAPVLSQEKIIKAHERFVDNLAALVADAREGGAEVLLVDSVRNLKNDFYLRFHVEPRDVEPARAEEWKTHYREGVELKKAERHEQALAALTKARDCYRVDRDEILNYYIAQCLESLGRYEKAKEEYERSFMKHALKIRLREVAKRAGAPLLDPYAAVCREAPHRIPDESLFMDSFHPMPATNGILAEEILKKILEDKLIKNLPRVGASVLEAAKQLIRTEARGVEVYSNRKIQMAVNRGKYAEAVAEAAKIAAHEKNYVTLMYLGYAQSKMNDRDGARQTWLQLKREVLGPRENASVPVPPLKTDEDVVKHLFDGDLFSEF